MMRKKQISRMLIGAFVACMAAACSNETEVLNGLPTDGNTLSVNLRTNDIGAATRTIATDEELEVNNISAYLFDENGTLEKAYKDLNLKESDGKYTVALTHIENRGPKTIYFVANGAGITALNDVEGISKEAFQDLMMNEMTANPETPLAMTAQAELAEWGESVNNAEVTATLERVSARIDLKVDEQAGLTFEPTKIEMAAAANSYIFPNETVYEGEETVTISGMKLYPYESAAGAVQEVKVTGNVTVGETVKEGVTFTVPFVNASNEAIAIERNHRYTVHITRINGFFSVEATVTVSDWSAADASGDLKAGEELKMTATEFANEQLAAEPAATAVYPTNDTKSDKVELTAADAKVYKIYVGSANIEAVTSWNALPEGWTIAEPADTRAEYLWEKSYWTLTIPANESQEAKSFTVKAVNKLELAKDANTEKFVEITFTQEGKEEVVDHSKNPLLKWAEYNLTSTGDFTNDFTNNLYSGGSLYQWGRNHGFKDYKDAMGTFHVGSFPEMYYYDYAVWGNDEAHCGTGLHFYQDWAIQEAPHMYESAADIANYPTWYMMNASWSGNSGDYWVFSNGGKNWYERAEVCGYTSNNPAPQGWRLPTEDEFKEIAPSINLESSSSLSNLINGRTELRTTQNGVKYAIRWISKHNSIDIQAIVVSENFEDSSLSSINWSSIEVVTRTFPYTGKIAAYNVRHAWSYNLGGGYDYVSRPVPIGRYQAFTKEYVYSIYESVWLYQLNVIADYSTSLGGYWMSDSKKAFKFVDNNISGQSDQTSCLLIETSNAHDAFAIRCVKDDSDSSNKQTMKKQAKTSSRTALKCGGIKKELVKAANNN